MAPCGHGTPDRILLDRGPDGPRLDSRRNPTVEGWIGAGDSLSAGCTVAIGPGRDADPRGRGTVSGISQRLDVGAAYEVCPTQMATARECGVRTCGGVERPSIDRVRPLISRPTLPQGQAVTSDGTPQRPSGQRREGRTPGAWHPPTRTSSQEFSAPRSVDYRRARTDS